MAGGVLAGALVVLTIASLVQANFIDDFEAFGDIGDFCEKLHTNCGWECHNNIPETTVRKFRNTVENGTPEDIDDFLDHYIIHPDPDYDMSAEECDQYHLGLSTTPKESIRDYINERFLKRGMYVVPNPDQSYDSVNIYHVRRYKGCNLELAAMRAGRVRYTLTLSNIYKIFVERVVKPMALTTRHLIITMLCLMIIVIMLNIRIAIRSMAHVMGAMVDGFKYCASLKIPYRKIIVVVVAAFAYGFLKSSWEVELGLRGRKPCVSVVHPLDPWEKNLQHDVEHRVAGDDPYFHPDRQHELPYQRTGEYANS